jgi:hypothetical protein
MKKNLGREPAQKNLDLDFFDNQKPGDSILNQLSSFVEANDDTLLAASKIEISEDLSKDSSGIKDFLKETNKNLPSFETPNKFSQKRFSQDCLPETTDQIPPFENFKGIVEKVANQSTHS